MNSKTIVAFDETSQEEARSLGWVARHRRFSEQIRVGDNALTPSRTAWQQHGVCRVTGGGFPLPTPRLHAAPSTAATSCTKPRGQPQGALQPATAREVGRRIQGHPPRCPRPSGPAAALRGLPSLPRFIFLHAHPGSRSAFRTRRSSGVGHRPWWCVAFPFVGAVLGIVMAGASLRSLFRPDRRPARRVPVASPVTFLVQPNSCRIAQS